jgi:predicted hydrolase (HD superfamily)
VILHTYLQDSKVIPGTTNKTEKRTKVMKMNARKTMKMMKTQMRKKALDGCE